MNPTTRWAIPFVLCLCLIGCDDRSTSALSKSGNSARLGDVPREDAPSFIVIPSTNGIGGSIQPSVAVKVLQGRSTSFTLTPAKDYAVSGLGGSCQGTLDGTTYTTSALSGNCTVVAYFSPKGSLINKESAEDLFMANSSLLVSASGHKRSPTPLSSVAVGSDGTIYIADPKRGAISIINPDGKVSTRANTEIELSSGQTCFAQQPAAVMPCATANFLDPSDVAVPGDGGGFFTETGLVKKNTNTCASLCNEFTFGSHNPEYVSDPAGVVTDDDHYDKNGKNIIFSTLGFISSDANGSMYVSDGMSVHKILPNGSVFSIEGGFSHDFISSFGNISTFSIPAGITVDARGNIFIVDSTAALFRKFSPVSQVTNNAGNHLSNYLEGFTDGPANLAIFSEVYASQPIEAKGNLFEPPKGMN